MKVSENHSELFLAATAISPDQMHVPCVWEVTEHPPYNHSHTSVMSDILVVLRSKKGIRIQKKPSFSPVWIPQLLLSLNKKSQSKYRCWQESGDTAELMGQERRRNKGMILELTQVRAVSEISQLVLCHRTPHNPLINLGQFWLPCSAQLIAAQKCTWKKNPAEHTECRQSPGYPTKENKNKKLPRPDQKFSRKELAQFWQILM